MNTEKLFKKQIARCRAAVQHLNDAADLLQKARIDDVPDDVRELSKEISGLMDQIESRLNDPHQNVVDIHDYMPTR